MSATRIPGKSCRPVLLFLLGCLIATSSASARWPTRSSQLPNRLGHPQVEALVEGLSPSVDQGYSFVVFGDQRALADGEWQQMMGHIGGLSEQDRRLLFMIDTGDMVKDGRHTDQFVRLSEILSPAAGLAYLVAVGNHELKNNTSRDHAAVVFGYLDPQFSGDRMYYQKDIGAVRFLFLDTNDMVYGDHGHERSFERADRQMSWLESQLADDRRGPDAVTVVVMHHPFLLSASKHRGQTLRLWNQRWGGHYLPELLIESGVDLVLTGHTHTYERFVLQKDDRKMHLVNVSGRPRGFFSRGRRAKDLRGREDEALRAVGYERLEGWTISQTDAMPRDTEANQFALISVDKGGGLSLVLYYLDEGAAEGVRTDAAVRLE